MMTLSLRTFWSFAICLLSAVSALAAEAGVDPEIEEFALFLRTRNDPNVPADMSVCAKAPFKANVALGASVWAPRTRARDAGVVNPFANQVGTGTACMQITDLRMPRFSRVPVYAHFDLVDGSYTGVGECLVTTQNSPVFGVFLMDCAADVTSAPADVIGATASTTTLINLYKVPGYETGSYMTIRGFRVKQAGDGDGDGDRHDRHGRHDGDVQRRADDRDDDGRDD
ncbi:MAG: hypothetical protein HY903_20965 [Deltaproteobacteria bacterium]|nr:hypothetical protein [Deltaproteobacteria bacterium]